MKSNRSYVRASWAVLGAAITVAAANCGQDPGSQFPVGSPCHDVYRDACGAACSVDGDCLAGLYCNNGECYADCVPGGNQCPANATCSDNGRCAVDTSSGGGTLTSGAGGGSGGSCGAVEITFAPQTPSVVLLIDQSGSMTASFNGQARWDVVYDALMNPVDGVVKQLESTVRFALSLYTESGAPSCPELVELMPPALNNHAAIDAIYAPEQPVNNTPTGESLAAVANELAAFTEPGPKLIILATDGDPDRCADPDGHDQISKDLATVAAQAAFAQDIETVIIAVGDQVSLNHQQDMANAGSGKPVPATFPCDPVADPQNCAPTYQPATKQALVDAFLNIINGKRTCVFTLDGAVLPGKECDGTVTINGTEIPCNDPNGWQLNSPTEIEFVGAACDTIMNDPTVDIAASFPCESIAEPPK